MAMTDERAGLLSLIQTIAAMRSEMDRPASLAVVETTIRRGHMPPLHRHDADEAFYVLEGTLTVHAGEESVRLEAGEAFLAPRDLPHTHQAESDRVRYLSVTFARSLGRYEDFLRAVGAPTGEGWRTADEAGTVAGISRPNGITVLGPPGALPADSAH